jgi:hypothetical protein
MAIGEIKRGITTKYLKDFKAGLIPAFFLKSLSVESYFDSGGDMLHKREMTLFQNTVQRSLLSLSPLPGVMLTVLLFSLFSSIYSEQCSFTIARLKYDGGGDWYANPSSLPNLAKAVKKRTKIEICDTIATVSINDDRLFHYPFLYMTGHGDVHFNEQQRIRLRRYLIGGGFLWADDNYGLDKSFRNEMALLFPENPLTLLPSHHSIYRSNDTLAALPKIHEHDGDPAQGFGIFFDNRLLVFYTFSSDIGDGMENLEVHNDGPKLHDLALRMGVNVISYFFNP